MNLIDDAMERKKDVRASSEIILNVKPINYTNQRDPINTTLDGCARREEFMMKKKFTIQKLRNIWFTNSLILAPSFFYFCD